MSIKERNKLRLYYFKIHLEQRVNHFIVKAKERGTRKKIWVGETKTRRGEDYQKERGKPIFKVEFRIEKDKNVDPEEQEFFKNWQQQTLLGTYCALVVK